MEPMTKLPIVFRGLEVKASERVTVSCISLGGNIMKTVMEIVETLESACICRLSLSEENDLRNLP